MKLKAWRKAWRVTPFEVAEALDCTRQAVHVYERELGDGGRLPPSDKLEALIRFTGGAVTPNDWFDIPAILSTVRPEAE